MRRAVLLLAAGAAAAAVLASGALAKEAGIELSSKPYNVRAGVAWMGTLTLISPERQMLRQARPYVVIRNVEAGPSERFEAKPVSADVDSGDSRQYSFRVVFPTAGVYRYTASDGLTPARYTFPAVKVAPDPLAASKTGPRDAGASSHWPVVGGLGGVGLAAALVLPFWRRRSGRR